MSPTGRAARPEDAARALLFLVENPYITNETLVVDDGWTIHSPAPRLGFVESKE